MLPELKLKQDERQNAKLRVRKLEKKRISRREKERLDRTMPAQPFRCLNNGGAANCGRRPDRLTPCDLCPYVPGDAPALVAAILESTPTLAPWMPWATAQFSTSAALAWIASCENGWADATCF